MIHCWPGCGSGGSASRMGIEGRTMPGGSGAVVACRAPMSEPKVTKKVMAKGRMTLKRKRMPRAVRAVERGMRK